MARAAKYTKFKWRLYADNNMEKEIIEYLRGVKFDVLWIAEDAKLRREKDDSFHYVKAKQLSRYLLTDDLDFWNDRIHPLRNSPA